MQEFLPALLLGWALGTALVFLVRWLGQHLITEPCSGKTLVALSMPLLLGPGGLAFTALSWRRPRRAALGLGLVVASFLPGLYVGARDIGLLRTQGCAGGYVVIAAPGTKSIGTLTLRPGETRQLTGRIGGYQRQNYPEVFTLRAGSLDPSIKVTLGKTQVHAGESFPMTVTAVPGAPLNTYKVGVQGVQTVASKTYEATGTLEVDVH
ncbi:hypothetical protein [Deinococcus sp.]|uniref:hypothetical protein n=1 Tax=Deinococcus sp. TaxID=47478 RepID=UPI0025C584ED|nr:hypothetical protein [Deinococcus sp.]